MVEPYSVVEIQRIMHEAASRPNAARWAIALALGLRQGEVLALTWSDVDLAGGTRRVRSTRLRPTFEHGCGGFCGRAAAGNCPERRQTSSDVGETKSAAGQRVVGLPVQLVALLGEHLRQQERQRDAARQLWVEGGWVFTSPTGRPLNPKTDYREWKSLLRGAGVRDGRLHDARHSAATVLLLLGVPERAAMGIMGWSTTAMAARYQHITDPIRRDVAQRVGGLLWSDRRRSDRPCGREMRLKLRLPPRGRQQGFRPATASCLVRLAEDGGFEPPRGCPQHAFQACALGH